MGSLVDDAIGLLGVVLGVAVVGFAFVNLVVLGINFLTWMLS
jgi:hypothetical protein